MRILNSRSRAAGAYLGKFTDRVTRADSRETAVKRIISDVRRNGDRALLRYTRKFDGPVSSLRVTQDEIFEAYKHTGKDFVSAALKLIKRIEDFEKKNIRGSWMKESGGIITGQYVSPVGSAGIYVPGGRASYPSSLIMCAVPARLAGVKRIAVVSPPGRDGKIDPCVLAAADKLSIKEIYKVGGAQAIAALAYGTKTIKKVDMIVGPGNAFVSTAKRLVRGEVEIDALAGPSEICIIADKYANPGFIAADMLSQAEHDPEAVCLCLTDSAALAEKISACVLAQKEKLSRSGIIGPALSKAVVIITGSTDESVALSNAVAPEHLEILTKNPFSVLPGIRNAGAIFLGEYSPVALGDYAAGPSHVIPTAGAARFSSPLSVSSFLKRSNILSCTKKGFEKLAPIGIKMSETEGLDAHTNAIKIRKNV